MAASTIFARADVGSGPQKPDRAYETLSMLLAVVFFVIFARQTVVFLSDRSAPDQAVFVNFSLYVLGAFAAAVAFSVFVSLKLHQTRNLLRRKSRELDAMQPTVLIADNLTRLSELSQVMARHNALCDVQLLQIPFNPVDLSTKERAELLDASVLALTENIDNLLDVSADLLSQLTGNLCTTSVRILWNINVENRRLMDIDTSNLEFRNLRRSRYKREAWPIDDIHVVGNIFKTDESTILEKVVRERQQYFAGNHLLKMRNYKDGPYPWKLDYDSVLAVGIPAIHLDDPLSYQYGVFVADNKGGGFHNELCISNMREWSWRLSAMLYGLYRITCQIKELNGPSEAIRAGDYEG